MDAWWCRRRSWRRKGRGAMGCVYCIRPSTRLPEPTQMRSGHWQRWPLSSCPVRNLTLGPILLFLEFLAPCPCMRIFLRPGAPVLFQFGRPSLEIMQIQLSATGPAWTGDQRTHLDWVFKSASIQPGNWTTSWLNPHVIILTCTFETTTFSCSCGFYLYYFVIPPSVTLTKATGQFLSPVN